MPFPSIQEKKNDANSHTDLHLRVCQCLLRLFEVDRYHQSGQGGSDAMGVGGTAQLFLPHAIHNNHFIGATVNHSMLLTAP